MAKHGLNNQVAFYLNANSIPITGVGNDLRVGRATYVIVSVSGSMDRTGL